MTSVLTKSVLITGAGQRVGKGVARTLAAEGWAVAVHYNRSRAPAEELCAEIEDAGGKAVPVGANLLDWDETRGLADKAAAALGGLGAIVSCASTFDPDEAGDFTKASWDSHIDVNLKAPLLLAQALAGLLPPGETGAIVNIVDQRVFKPTPQFFTYTLSKLALWQATTTLAQALAPRIRVNAIAPGPTLRNARQSQEDFQKQLDATLLGKGSPLDEICAGVRYLLAASAVTGQTIAVDGGQHLIWQTPDVVGLSE